MTTNTTTSPKRLMFTGTVASYDISVYRTPDGRWGVEADIFAKEAAV